ncbi:MAG: DUF6036 family nucleotidyltransferase [bacterium]
MMWKWQNNKKLDYEDIFRQLEKEGVQYLLIGGTAVILHGVPRTTADVDLMLNMERNNLLKMVKAMKKLGYQPKVPVNPEELADADKRKQWQEEKNMIVFSFVHPDDPFMTIDVMLNSPLDFQESFNRRKVVIKWGATVALASIEDIIKLKEIAGRKQDLSDITLLQQIEELKNG